MSMNKEALDYDGEQVSKSVRLNLDAIRGEAENWVTLS